MHGARLMLHFVMKTVLLVRAVLVQLTHVINIKRFDEEKCKMETYFYDCLAPAESALVSSFTHYLSQSVNESETINSISK